MIGVKMVKFFIFATVRSIKTMYLAVTGVVFQKIVLKKAIELDISTVIFLNSISGCTLNSTRLQPDS